MINVYVPSFVTVATTATTSSTSRTNTPRPTTPTPEMFSTVSETGYQVVVIILVIVVVALIAALVVAWIFILAKKGIPFMTLVDEDQLSPAM